MPTKSLLEDEALITLKEVPDYLPKQQNGRKVSYGTVWRWVKKGAHGRVLESVKIGGIRYTSVNALDRFTDRCTAHARHPEDQQELRDVMYG